MPRVAFILLNLKSLKGGGGAERLMLDIYNAYEGGKRKNSVYLFTDSQSYKYLSEVKELKGENIFIIDSHYSKPLNFIKQANILQKNIEKYQVDIVYLGLIRVKILPFLWLLTLKDEAMKYKVIINIFDCRLAHFYENILSIRSIEVLKVVFLYFLFFKTARINTVISMYELAKQKFSSGIIKNNPKIYTLNSMFVNGNDFKPEKHKKNWIIFAARFVQTKRPDFFLQGIKSLINRFPDVLMGWEVRIYGSGHLDDFIKTKIIELQLEKHVKVYGADDMSLVFNYSKVFVSTQDFENYSSISMLEAMSSGNAIIARDVGDTHKFVRHEYNGLLLEEDTPKALGVALYEYIKDEKKQKKYSYNSVELVKREFNKNNTLDLFDTIWKNTV